MVISIKKFLFLGSFLLLFNCKKDKQLTVLAKLPKALYEVSGNEVLINSSLIWMTADSGNPSKLFGIDTFGTIQKTVKINSKNYDWEDLTSDEKGNLYMGDFGNNANKRKNLRILKVSNTDLDAEKATVEIIQFRFENQQQFPPKNNQLFFDAEAFFYFQKHFYIFTKSRVRHKFGQTYLFKIPSEKGNHIAKLIGEFYNGNENSSWITAADISDDGKQVALLSQKNVLIFTDFKDDNFFSGKLKTIAFNYKTQKEGLCFKDNKTLLLTDEKVRLKGGILYELKIKN
jgi:hypothetical protein